MPSFKLIFCIKSWGLVLLSFSLGACTLPKPDSALDSAGGSDFQVASLKGEIAGTDLHADSSIPKARLYNFTACLKDLARSRPLTGQKFRLEEINQDVQADSEGCVHWSEKVEFNYLASSTYLPWTRTLVGTGLTQGKRSLRFALDPWGHGQGGKSPVVNLDKEEVTSLATLESRELRQAGRLEDQSLESRRLWVEDARLLVTDDRLIEGGLSLTYQVTVTPQVALVRMSGEPYLEPLSRGRFKVTALVLHQDLVGGREVRRELLRASLEDVEIRNGTLPLRFPLLFPQVPKSGQLFLGLILEPQSAPAGLLNFEGLFPMGDYRQIKSPAFLKISPLVSQSANFKLAAFLAEKPATTEGAPVDSTATRPHLQTAKVEVAHLQFSLVQRGQESATKKELIYRVRACLTSGVDQDLLLSRPFKVHKFKADGQATAAPVLDIKTDNTSCLYWDEKISFDYYECQRFIKGHYRLQNTDLGLDEKIEALVNPWENSGAFAFDLRDVAGRQDLTLTCDPKRQMKSQLDLESISLSTQSYGYQIDHSLNLTLNKKMQLRLDPRVLIYSNLNQGIMERQPLRDGVYLLRLAVVRHKDQNEFTPFVTGAEKLVNVVGGRLVTDLELRSPDLKAFGTRQTLLLELLAVDPQKVELDKEGRPQTKAATTNLQSLVLNNSWIESPVFAGPLVLNHESSVVTLQQMQQTELANFLMGRSPEVTSASSVAQVNLEKILREGLAQLQERMSLVNKPVSSVDWARQQGLVKVEFAAGSQTLKDLNTKISGVRPGRFGPGMEKTRWLQARAQASPLANLEALKTTAREARLTPELAPRFCEALLLGLWDEVLKPQASDQLVRACREGAAKKPSDYFVVQPRWIVQQIGKQKFLRGFEREISTGTSFSLSRSHSKSYSETTSVGAQAGAQLEFFDILSMGISGSYQLSWSEQDSESQDNSVSVAEFVALDVQENQFQIEILSHEKCVEIRLNPAVFAPKASGFWDFLMGTPDHSQGFKDGISPAQKVAQLQKGYLVCTGEVDKKSVVKNESYYLVSQNPRGGNLQDAADDRSRSLFLMLRGQGDYLRFLTAIKASHSGPANVSVESDSNEKILGGLEAVFLKSGSAPGHLIPGR